MMPLMPQRETLNGKSDDFCMKDQEEMMEEEDLQVLSPEPDVAEADSATAALTAGRTSEPEDAGVPEEEQEDPYAGRDLPGEDELREDAPGEKTPEPEEDGDHAGEGEEEAIQAAAPVTAGRQHVPMPAAVEPAPVTPDAARQQYWRGVLTGTADTVPDAVRERAGVDDAGLEEEQGEYRLLSTINRSWAVDNLGVSREQVRSGWTRLRGELAKRFHVADDERELFTALSLEAQDAPLRERVKSLYEQHYSAALLGRETPVPQEGEEGMPYARGLAEEAQRRGRAFRRSYLPLARELAEGLNVFAGLEDDAFAAPRVLSSMPEFARSVEALAEMEEDERQLVYAIAQEEFRSQHPQQDGSLYRTMLRASRRGASGLGIGVGQALAHASVATMDSLGNMLGEEWGSALHKGARGLDVRARIVEEVRRLLYDEVKPLRVSKEAGLVGQLMVDAAGAAPGAVVACCGGAGFAALGVSGMGEAVAAARRRAPEGSQWLQYLAGVVGGGIQASIYAGMSRVGGQLLSNAISRFARASGKGVRGYTLASLGTLGAMGLEEAKLLFAGKAAEAAGLGTQELAARLDKTASNIDWREYGDNAQDVELNMREAAMNLPFILIASGRVALRHFRSRHAVLGEGHALKQWGIDEPTRDAIMKEHDINRQGDMLREALSGSRRWSYPGFLRDAVRALRLLNSDYYQGFKDPQTVKDFLNLPSQGGLVPRPPIVPYSVENPEHMKLLQERYGSGEKVNPKRLGIALKLHDEWTQKAHLVPEPVIPPWLERDEKGAVLPTSERRRYFGLELMQMGGYVPARMRPGGFYAPKAEAERMAMLRDRVAEIHDLSYQMLLSSFPLDALSHSTRSLDHLRQASEMARTSLLEAVGRCVLRRAAGMEEGEALDELGKAVTNYVLRRRYSQFPPAWMSRVKSIYTSKLDEYARATFSQELSEAPAEFLAACRVALGLRSCASALYELLPMTPDFQTTLARGLMPAEAYVHLLTRELGVDFAKVKGIAEMLAPLMGRRSDMRSYRVRNKDHYEAYSALTGYKLERARGAYRGAALWRVRRPDGSYTRWHPRKGDAVNDLTANASFIFMPFSYDRMAPLRDLRLGKHYDINTEGWAGSWKFTGYDNLCRVALRDTARAWVEMAPYAQPGFDLGMLRRYVFFGGQNQPVNVLMNEGNRKDNLAMQVDSYTLSSPLRLVQARFHTYWWRQLNSGVLPAEAVGDELVRLRVMSPEQWQGVKDIAKPPLMPKDRDVPLKLTPPPDTAGMNRALTSHLTDFSMRYFLAHLDEMPLPSSAREWFRLAPLCQLPPGKLPERAVRLRMKRENEWFTCWHNRVAAREVRELGPAVAELRLAEQEGLLDDSPLLEGLHNAVGLNSTLNLEQAWSTHSSGGEAMMGAHPAFWRLMERPLEGWKMLVAFEQKSLRTHVDAICRAEPSPETVEAEARGEKPDYVVDALRNLQEVLQDYPELHRYGLDIENSVALRSGRAKRSPGHVIIRNGHRFRVDVPSVRQVILDDPARGENQEQGVHPFAEPEYEPVALYTGGRLQNGFRLGEALPLPDFLQDDPRVLPALHLLEGLRTYPASRPYVRREGIYWKGRLYGGYWGRRPKGMGEDWVPETPLRDLIAFLRRIDELEATPDGRKLTQGGLELHGLDGELNLTPLRHVTLYRNLDNLSQLCRLMPGEPDSANPAARSPYVVQSVAGMVMGGTRALVDWDEMYRAFAPLENFHPRTIRIEIEGSREAASRRSLSHTLSCALSDCTRRIEQGNPRGGYAGLRELLLRFAEDSGFSLSLRKADPRALSSGQVLTLQLARELLLSVCGTKPGAALERLAALSRRISCDREERNLVLVNLFRAADNLYSHGTRLFRDPKPRRKRAVKKVQTSAISDEDKRLLEEWERQNRDFCEDFDTDFMDGYNNDVRSDGYSKGFFDD